MNTSLSGSQRVMTFLGIRFWSGGCDELMVDADMNGGVTVVPAAPALGEAGGDPLLFKAYRDSDFAVVDGGYIALIIRLLGRRTRRISGLQILEKSIDAGGASCCQMLSKKILWVVPSAEEKGRIGAYLEAKGYDGEKQLYYEAPFYRSDDEFDDEALQRLVADKEPDWVIICLGGGRQEKLGMYLRNACVSGGVKPNGRENGPLILCTGAAIAFFTGGQAKIPVWADRLYLGWFFRVMENPKAFLPRYVKAFWSFPLLLFRERGRIFESSPAR